MRPAKSVDKNSVLEVIMKIVDGRRGEKKAARTEGVTGHLRGLPGFFCLVFVGEFENVSAISRRRAL